MECTGNALGRAKKCSTTQPPPGCDGAHGQAYVIKDAKEKHDDDDDDDNNNNNNNHYYYK